MSKAAGQRAVVARGARALVTRSAAEAAAALRLAGDAAVLLLSAQGAASYLGARGWCALMEQTRALAPRAIFDDALCCGNAAGHAMAALRAGCRLIVLDGQDPAFPAVAAAADEIGAAVLPERPASLDLRGLDLRKPGAQAILARWLAGSPDDSARGNG